MLNRGLAISALFVLSGCSFNTQVQRFGVEYNEALASMANEQTLLNILRTSYGMPAHFSSVSRFNGTLSMKGSASVGGQLRGSGLTRTDSSAGSLSTATTLNSVTAPTGTTTTNGIVTTPGSTNSVVSAVAEGVDLYTPQLGGELSSGTGFEVQVFDQQKFYQGILTAVPFSTVEMFINQGFEPDLVANLLIARVDFYVEDAKIPGKKKGAPIASYRNEASDRARFQNLIDCNELRAAGWSAPDTKLVPISRLDLGTAPGRDRLTLSQLGLFDGDKFGLSSAEGIGPDGSTDRDVFVVKPGAKARIAKFEGRGKQCNPWPTQAGTRNPEGVYFNDGTADSNVGGDGKPYLDSDGIAESRATPVVLEVTFRSPEAVLRAVGENVRLQRLGTFRFEVSAFAQHSPPIPDVLRRGIPMLAVCPTGGTNCEMDVQRYEPMFTIEPSRLRGTPLTTRFLDSDHSIPASSYRSMQVITIIQQLINLQKESSERALSVPVRAVQ